MKTIPSVVKRYIRIEKKSQKRSYIYDFNVLIKLLYPYRQSINKYERLTNQMSFNTSQKALLKQVIHSLTVLNETYRDQDKIGRLYTTREDVINGIVLLQNELDLKDQKILFPYALQHFYKELKTHFIAQQFTSREVCRKIRKSKSSCYRNLSELVDRNKVKLVGRKQQSFVYQLIEEK